MKDFAEWVHAGEGAFGWQSGTFLAAYKANQATAAGLELEASPVGQAVLNLMEMVERWEGTATDLLEALDHARSDFSLSGRGQYPPQGWPRNGKALSGQLTRAAGSLRSCGIEFTRGHSGDRSITLERQPSKDAPDAKLPQFPISTFKEKEEEEIGKVRELASVSSVASNPVDAWGRTEDDPEYCPF